MAKGLNGGNTLSYMGVNAPQPPNMTQHDRAPDVDDYQSFELGDFWINQAPTNPINHELYILVAKVNKRATWVMLYPNIGTASVISLNGLSGVLNLTAGDNISVTPAGLAITLAVAGTTQYAVQVGNASGSLTSLALGTTGEVLTSNGVGNFPSWQSLSAGVTSLNSLTGDLNIVAGNNMVITPSGTDIYVGLTGTTNHCIQLGNAAGGISSFILGTAGAVLRSQGNGSDPAWSVASYPNTVAKGDILVASATNTISAVSGAATAGYVLTANGAGTTPTFQAAGSGGIVTINGNSGSVTGATVLISGNNNITTSGTATTLTLNLTGTTQYALQTGSAAGALTSLPLGTANQVLTSNGVGAAPTWQATQNAVTSVSGTTNQITVSPTTGATVVSLVASPMVTGTWTTSAGNLSLPTTTSTAGQITINSVPVLHTYGLSNTFIGGAGNLTFNTTYNSSNVGIGPNALSALSGTAGYQGSNNVAIGISALRQLTEGNSDICLGYGSGLNLISGAGNCLHGTLTGQNYTGNESYNILIGYHVYGNAGTSNELYIGSGTGTLGGNIAAGHAHISGIYGAGIAASNPVYITSGNVIGTATSRRDTKHDIEDVTDESSVIYKLRVRKFRMNNDPVDLMYGFIAEEVEEISKELVTYDGDGRLNNVIYASMAPMLVKEIQKLSKKIEDLEKEIKCLQD